MPQIRTLDTLDELEQSGMNLRSVFSGFAQAFESESIAITVGEGNDRKVFHVHKAHLIKHSEYFKGLFSFNSNSGNEMPEQVSLEKEAHPDVFKAFLEYIYLGQFDQKADDDQKSYGDLLFCCQVYVLAEFLGVLGLKKLSLIKATNICYSIGNDEYDFVEESYPSIFEEFPETVAVVYNGTPGPSKPTPAAADAAGLPRKKAKVTKKSQTRKRGSTSTRSSNAAELSTTPEPTADKLRILISRFAGMFLTFMKKAQGFNDCVREFPDFAADLISNVGDGRPLMVDEEGQLIVNDEEEY